MQGCTTYIQSLQGCVHLARDDRKVACTLQMLMQGCHKLAATLLQPCKVATTLLLGCHNLEISIWVTTINPDINI